MAGDIFAESQRQDRAGGNDFVVADDNCAVVQRRFGIKNRLQKQVMHLGIKNDSIIYIALKLDIALDNDQCTALFARHFTARGNDFHNEFTFALSLPCGETSQLGESAAHFRLKDDDQRNKE